MPSADTRTPPPTLGLMHAVFILAGLGTMLLGPILPLLSTQWELKDSQAGLLLLSQFIGATLGGVTVSAKLSRDLLIGLVAGAIGFSAFAFAPGLGWACPALVVGGFGVGRIIATVNILAGSRYTANRAAALTRLNFTWSFGALLSPLLAAWLAPHVAPRTLLGSFATCFALCSIALLVQFNDHTAPQTDSSQPTPAEQSIAPTLFLYFAALLFLYGGLETCLSGWLTTYALRYGKTSFVLSEYTLVLLLAGLTAGRALASWLLLKMRDTALQRIALVLSAALAAALAAAHQAGLIATLAVLLGVALAPIFPATFAIFLASRPPARIAGIVLAASGLGAAALPSLIGVISTRTGSLQLALTVPVATAIAMLALTLISPTQRRSS
jgi:FHS family glucose/mannose:H+ symporter-like MFS transporter